ncbi:MAG: DUF5069 domain-containing protein [Verrucomicrobiota bacterium]
MSKPPTIIPGLRSPYEQVGGIVLFGRMLDKIRLHAAGKLPEDWVVALGADRGFDGRVCRFLKIDFVELQAETLKGGSDGELLAWVFENGRKPSEEEIEVWNGFMMKVGWRDSYSERCLFRLEEAGLPTDLVSTMFDFIDLDEGRPSRWG